MGALEHAITNSVPLAWVVILLAFGALFKSASVFVDSSVALANRFNVPRLVIGIVLVSLATTAPELSVSLMAALKGNPEMALGNAIGSVICDDGLALALAGVFTLAPIAIIPAVLNGSALLLIAIQVLTFLFVVFDFTLSRAEGLVLVVLFAAYILFLFRQHRRGVLGDEILQEASAQGADAPAAKLFCLFALALGGIIVASEFIIVSASTIAVSFGMPQAVVAMTLVAFGTSVPEVATCITAARKGEGAIAVGNILGADIMNICWVAGASAIANDLTLRAKDIWFMFPSMFIIVGAMLLLLRSGYTLTRRKGLVLFVLYLIYLGCFFFVFPPQANVPFR